MENKKCFGCFACKNICPKNAIKMVADEEGFLYPSIIKNKCINCNLCKQVCPLSKKNCSELKNKNIGVYALKHKKNSVIKNSTSGGAFTAITDYVLKQKGIIYGAVYDKNFKVIHLRMTNSLERNKARGSKYVQSCLDDVFIQVKQDLEKDKFVLFSGTPCQIAGLRMYLDVLNVNQYKLILCDIVCNGVSSPKIFSEHIEMLKKTYGKFKKYNFRDKSFGNGSRDTSIILYNNRKIKNTTLLQSYLKLYYDGLISRPICHECKFTDIKRVSDITIGDFWGIEKSIKNFDDNYGVNLVLLNTKKGFNLYQKIKSNIKGKKSCIENCIQPRLQRPACKNKKRSRFWKQYYKKGYNYILVKYTFVGFNSRFKSQIKKVASKIIPSKIIKDYINNKV